MHERERKASGSSASGRSSAGADPGGSRGVSGASVATRSRLEISGLRRLVAFDRAHTGTYPRDTNLQRLVALTAQRSNNTALAVANLLADNQIEQAQMLCRPLFEDMAVVHWLVMQDDPAFLIERFFDHQDAMMLQDHDHFTKSMGLPYGDQPGLERALANRADLVKTFGDYAQRSWWAVRPDGTQLTLAGLVEELQTHQAYVPRLHGGDEPILRDTYALANRWANQQLHHTGRGFVFVMQRDGAGQRDRDILLRVTAMNAYWTFGQTLFLQLEQWSPDPSLLPEYQKLFHDTMSECFHGGMSLDDARAALADARRDVRGE